RTRHGMEGLRRARRDVGRAAEGGAEADRVNEGQRAAAAPPHGAADAALLASAASLPPAARADDAGDPHIDPATPRALLPLARLLALANRAMVAIGMLALLAASIV